MKTNARVLIVDDEEKNRKLISVILDKNGYESAQAVNGMEALSMMDSGEYDLVLLDVMLPEIDGYDVCRQLKKNARSSTVPVIIITSLSDRNSRLKGLEAGASDFLTKPIDSTELLLRCNNLLKVREYENILADYNRQLTFQVEQKTHELKESYRDTILRLTKMSEYKDEETTMHIRRVSLYCAEIANKIGWSSEDTEIIELASPMHDIGKVGIPSEILLKRGKLSDVEFSLMKTHAEIGAEILSGSSSKVIQMSERIARCHHERWDGGGYPKGLQGNEIPIEARVMNIADQYDALRSSRPYKPSFTHEQVFDIITRGDGRTQPEHFDPEILEIFKTTHAEFRRIYDSF